MLTDRLDKIFRLWMPKIEQFYAAHEPDMWVKSVDDFENAYKTGDENVITQSLAVLEYRRKKMLEIYKSFTELTQEPLPNNPVIEAIIKSLYADSDEQTKRKLTRCDWCHKSVSESQLTLYRDEEITEDGDPRIFFRTICEECRKRRIA